MRGRVSRCDRVAHTTSRHWQAPLLAYCGLQTCLHLKTSHVFRPGSLSPEDSHEDKHVSLFLWCGFLTDIFLVTPLVIFPPPQDQFKSSVWKQPHGIFPTAKHHSTIFFHWKTPLISLSNHSRGKTAVITWSQSWGSMKRSRPQGRRRSNGYQGHRWRSQQRCRPMYEDARSWALLEKEKRQRLLVSNLFLTWSGQRHHMTYSTQLKFIVLLLEQ